MEVQTRLEKLTLDEKEIEALCDYLMNNPNEPNIVVDEILRNNGMKWEAPIKEEFPVEVQEELNEDDIIVN